MKVNMVRLNLTEEDAMDRIHGDNLSMSDHTAGWSAEVNDGTERYMNAISFWHASLEENVLRVLYRVIHILDGVDAELVTLKTLNCVAFLPSRVTTETQDRYSVFLLPGHSSLIQPTIGIFVAGWMTWSGSYAFNDIHKAEWVWLWSVFTILCLTLSLQCTYHWHRSVIVYECSCI